MSLSVRRPPYTIPSYSLTGDLLAYLKCGLQYRYHNRGALPPSTPVQLWFGEFIHGVLEESFLRWKADPSTSFPWQWKPTIWDIESTVDTKRLRPKGLVPPPNLFDSRGIDKRLASRRAESAINTWGPELFPLIDEAEVKLRGIRPLNPPTIQARADYYEIQGVVDVIGSLALGKAKAKNRIVAAIEKEVGGIEGLGKGFEVIVDYKGMRRPPLTDPTWSQFEWQLRTYAWLRQMQPSAIHPAAGIVLFLNELVPSSQDIATLRAEVVAGKTDVVPSGSDRVKLLAWKPRTGRKANPTPSLSLSYRLRRSIRVIPVDDPLVQQSLANFDLTVWEIEAGVAHEVQGQPITSAWGSAFLSAHPPPGMETCTACDFKTFCPIIAKPAGVTVP